MYHRLGAGAPSQEVESLNSAVESAIKRKARSVTVGLDAVDELDATILGGLITALRRMREVGGTVRLHVTRRELKDALGLTGLDRVFEIASTRKEPAKNIRTISSEPKKPKITDGIAAIVAALLVLASSTIAAFAQGGTTTGESLTAEQIVGKIIERNPALNSFQAHVDVRLHTGIPFLNPTLEGTTYFKRPDNYEVIFTKVPSYARGIQKLYSDIGDPIDWAKRYTIEIAGDQVYNGHRDIVLRLVERVRGMIDHEDVLVDPRAWTVEKMSYFYYNGGFITLEQTFRAEGGFSVLADQHATIALAHLPRAIGTAHYSGYRLNVAIDDAVFTMQQTKELGTK